MRLQFIELAIVRFIEQARLSTLIFPTTRNISTKRSDMLPSCALDFDITEEVSFSDEREHLFKAAMNMRRCRGRKKRRTASPLTVWPAATRRVERGERLHQPTLATIAESSVELLKPDKAPLETAMNFAQAHY